MSPPSIFPTSIKETTDSLNATRASSDPTKPCRACTDFKTWAKMQSQSSKSKTPKPISAEENNIQDSVTSMTMSNNANERRMDCPVDKDELGSATWTFLHTMAAYYPDKPTTDEKKQMKQFISLFANFYPCDSCASHFRDQISEEPPAVESQETLSKWFCKMHNNVNIRVNKPAFDCSLVNQRWRDGWLDGSCD